MEKLKDKYHVAVLGSGISGSITALILSKLGYSTVLIDKATHPRFALGESSTYITAEILKFISIKYDVPELQDLAYYADIVDKHSDIVVGSKQYFEYMWHGLDNREHSDKTRIHEVVSELPRPVCQYYRQDLDHHVFKLAISQGADALEGALITNVQTHEGVQISCEKENASITINADFVVDASGASSVLNRIYNFRNDADTSDIPLKSRAIFTHFSGVSTLESVMSSNDQFNKHWSIDRKLATQHHCFDGGWFWFIPFNNGITSVGLSLDLDVFPKNDVDAKDEFWSIVNRLPVVKSMLSDVENKIPYIKTSRLQHNSTDFAGERWVALSSVAFGLDAWQSSGLATTFMSIDRVVDLLHNQVLSKNNFDSRVFDPYVSITSSEFEMLSKMIHGVYKSFKHPEIFKLYCLVPFIGTLNFMMDKKYEEAIDPKNMIFNFGDFEFTKKFETAYTEVLKLNKKDVLSEADVDNFRNILLVDMEQYNHRQYGEVSKNDAYFAKTQEVDALL